MSNISFIISNFVLGLATFILFFLSFLIYKRVVGGSYAYRCWANAAFIIFVYALLEVVGSIFVGKNHFNSSNLNEIFQVTGYTLNAIGYFYIPLGLLYLSSDLGIYHLNNKKIYFLEKLWIVSMLISFGVFMALIPKYYIVKVFMNTYNIMFTFVWIFSIVVYYKPYIELKKTSLAWTYIFLGLVSSLFKCITRIIRDFGISSSIGNLVGIFDALLGIFFILAFYKLGKTVEAF